MKVLRSFKLFFQLSTYREIYNLTWLAVRNQLHGKNEPVIHEEKPQAKAFGAK